MLSGFNSFFHRAKQINQPNLEESTDREMWKNQDRESLRQRKGTDSSTLERKRANHLKIRKKE